MCPPNTTTNLTSDHESEISQMSYIIEIVTKYICLLKRISAP